MCSAPGFRAAGCVPWTTSGSGGPLVIPEGCTARGASAVLKHSPPRLRNPKQGDELVCAGPALITDKYLMIGFPGRLRFLWQPREQGWCCWAGGLQARATSTYISMRSAATAHPRMFVLFCKANETSPWEEPDA